MTPAAVDRIDEENAGCVTARVMCPTGNNPEDFVTEPALTFSTPIKGRLIISDSGSCLRREARWFK